jgi:hypothetical protein
MPFKPLFYPGADRPNWQLACFSVTLQMVGVFGELAGTRTQDPRLKRALLYQLSYELSP